MYKRQIWKSELQNRLDSIDREKEAWKQKGLDEVKSANDMVQGMEKAMLVLNSDGQLEEF